MATRSRDHYGVSFDHAEPDLSLLKGKGAAKCERRGKKQGDKELLKRKRKKKIK